MHLKTCWSPCFWHPSVRSGSFAVALYSLLMSICIITYTVYVMVGGDASQLYLPLFEASLSTTTQHAGRFLIIYFIYMVIVSGLLMWGIKADIRGLMIPWLVGMGIIIVFQAAFGLWLIFGYYIYLEVVFAALVNWSWMSYNVYCYYTVQYRIQEFILKKFLL
ncbi:uncharacterized protein LOC111695522 [Eurytemora carolleeae]|uniref:uncharacterized protein LOC111695522 n=1 Tax=Eurytemora carolleeae TaxID=1294199 RepID=UPI000C773D64|nr:uncharacterized protein LOC111695522 [Eurytemora carolleeae]|eukprot:XP_023320658.1 uncharacterized protein LOC111695522 [Eurytemora affinis]